ncbi:HAD family phosphatase [Candidatus Dependentiae bacterium]|jgi:beta-phosphoglucomutase|nr:HAD family phosphatase [Candidatus Dependentiae bacterium]
MKDIKNRVKAVIFDMDGTIINTEQIWKKVTFDFLSEHGFTELDDNALKFLRSFSGIGMTHAAEQLKSYFGLAMPLEQIITKKIDLANTHFEQAIDFIEGFELFHNKLSDNQIPTSIATNATLSNLEKLSTKMNFTKFFGQNLYCVDHVGKAKPDPALFLHAAQMLGADPAECVVFEDSVYGFQAAKAAGMKCIAIKNDLNQNHLIDIHSAIDTYHDAEEALKKI